MLSWKTYRTPYFLSWACVPSNAVCRASPVYCGATFFFEILLFKHLEWLALSAKLYIGSFLELAMQSAFYLVYASGDLPDETFDFYPNSAVDFNLCFSDVGSRVIMWAGGQPDSVQQSVTTRQLLVSSGFMIQFKVLGGISYFSLVLASFIF